MTSDTQHDATTPSPSADDSADQETGEMAEHRDSSGKPTPQSKPSNGQTKSASNAKDPLRPRRKKARRACYACQRAHLTCGRCLRSHAKSPSCVVNIYETNYLFQATRGRAQDVSSVAYRTSARMACGRKQSICMMLPMMLSCQV
jgi:hypothetical protein